jgi:hypothetical protein
VSGPYDVLGLPQHGYQVAVQRPGQLPDVWSVAIVGMGPRGLSVLERLLITVSGRPPDRPVVIWAIDPVQHGPGRVWRTDQPGYLTMNATAGEVTVRSPDNELLGRREATAAVSFAEWTTWSDGAKPGSADYPQRRQYGSYLRAMFDQLCLRAPPGVEVRPLLGAATGLHRVQGVRWLTLDDGRERLRVDKVILATGHAELADSSGEEALREFAERGRRLRYIGQGLTTDMPLSSIAPGSRVAVRGLGLTFYDVVRSLTLGRGGRFDRCVDGALRYLPSGREPVLCAGSRSALPFLARARIAQPPQTTPEPVALTLERLAALRSAARSRTGSSKLDFAADVEPLVWSEMSYAYYTCAASLRGGEPAARRIAADYRSLLDRTLRVDRDAARELVMAHGLGDLPEPEVTGLARPFGNTVFARPADFRRTLIEVLTCDVAEARKQITQSPVKAALEALRAVRPVLPAAVDFGGLLPDSHRYFLGQWAPMSFVLSAGPPAEHVEQMVALLTAGVLDIAGPAARFSADQSTGCFTVESPAVTGSRHPAETMLDARVPTTNLRRDRSPLVRQLLSEGVITEYVNAGPDGQQPFPTGGLAVTPTPCRVLDAKGRPDPDLYALGVATEHTRWFTQVGTGRPGHDSPFRREADAIARDVLADIHR